MSVPRFQADPARTALRATALDDYHRANVGSRRTGLTCLSADMMCRPSALAQPGTDFVPAQGSSVGPFYDLTNDGIPYRVLVVPMEGGASSPAFRTVPERTTDVLRAADRPVRSRNGHMRGVTFALQLAFGLPLGEGAERLDVDGIQVHVLEAYAMANLLLCSAVKAGSMSSRSTGLMRASCARHMRATIDILEPTLVISQGKNLDETLRATLGVTQPLTPAVARCELDGRRFVWVSLYHPTRHWDSLSRPYLHDVVAPAIGLGRQEALAT